MHRKRLLIAARHGRARSMAAFAPEPQAVPSGGGSRVGGPDARLGLYPALLSREVQSAPPSLVAQLLGRLSATRSAD